MSEAVNRLDESQGISATARVFDANVAIVTGSLAMCLVIAKRSPIAAINSVGGRLLSVLSPTRAIAVIDVTLLSTLQRHPDVVTAGSVSVDPQRFARFQQIIGIAA